MKIAIVIHLLYQQPISIRQELTKCVFKNRSYENIVKKYYDCYGKIKTRRMSDK